MKKLAWRVFEDDGGGLTLLVFRGHRPIFAHSGYENCRGQLKDDLKTLETGGDPDRDGWDGGDADPDKVLAEILAAPNWAVREVAMGRTGSETEIYPEAMGRAAMLELCDEED